MPEPMDVVEALLFASDTPVEAERIQEVLDLESAAVARELVDGLRARLDAEGRALQVMEDAERTPPQLRQTQRFLGAFAFEITDRAVAAAAMWAAMKRTASPTVVSSLVRRFGISMSKRSSHDMTISTRSRLSAPRSSASRASSVSFAPSTPR